MAVADEAPKIAAGAPVLVEVDDNAPKIAPGEPVLVEVAVEAPKIAVEVPVLVEVAEDAPKIAEDGAEADTGWLLWPNLKLNPAEGAALVD